MAFDPCRILPLLLFAAFLLSRSVHAKEVQYCSKNADYAVKVNRVDVSPDPVVRGKPATFSIYASTDEALSEGKLVIEVRYFGVYIHSETHKLCEKTSCPISVGDFVLSHTQTLPGYTPPGSYTLKMRMVGANGHLLTCINFDFKINLGSPFADN